MPCAKPANAVLAFMALYERELTGLLGKVRCGLFWDVARSSVKRLSFSRRSLSVCEACACRSPIDVRWVLVH